MSIKEKIEFKLLSRYKRKWNDEMLLLREKYENTLPKYELEEKNFIGAELLLNRNQLLTRMPENAVCAEIGVDKGEFSKEIIFITKPTKLHLVDAWGDSNRYHDGLKVTVAEKFKSEIQKEQVEMNIGFSTIVLNNFPDNYFDWVYLDTAHTYEITSEELSILEKKMKLNGIIAGHDFTICNWLGNFRYGVIEAVHEFCIKQNWKLIYLTAEVHQHRSFAIQKIK